VCTAIQSGEPHDAPTASVQGIAAKMQGWVAHFVGGFLDPSDSLPRCDCSLTQVDERPFARTQFKGMLCPYLALLLLCWLLLQILLMLRVLLMLSVGGMTLRLGVAVLM